MKIYIGWGKGQRPLKLYCGLSVYSMNGDRPDVGLDICCSPPWGVWLPPNARVLMDSGAFNDEIRLTVEGALERQLRYEELRRVQIASDFGEEQAQNWCFEAIVAYDWLIDEVWIAGKRHKRRWSLYDAEKALKETIENAAWLAEKRNELKPRHLVLPVQGVDAIQYTECTEEILKHAQSDDILGLGGWCIVGIRKTLLREFWITMHSVIPLAAQAGLNRIHIFGVTWHKALGGLLWLCDQHGLELSTDSSQPVRSAVFDHGLRGGEAIGKFVEQRRQELADLRSTKYYKEPPDGKLTRQLSFF